MARGAIRVLTEKVELDKVSTAPSLVAGIYVFTSCGYEGDSSRNRTISYGTHAPQPLAFSVLGLPMCLLSRSPPIVFMGELIRNPPINLVPIRTICFSLMRWIHPTVEEDFRSRFPHWFSTDFVLGKMCHQAASKVVDLVCRQICHDNEAL
jgi:hypothetical protein